MGIPVKIRNELFLKYYIEKAFFMSMGNEFCSLAVDVTDLSSSIIIFSSI